MNAPDSPSLPRYRHRKRISALRLSSDSVAPLPAYTSPPAQSHLLWQETEVPSDRPPDYPDSSDADADTEDFESDQPYVRPPLSPPLTSPRRYTHRHTSSRSDRRPPASASDPYLDSLLERSVHALELSNTLLRTSMSTQSSLSTILAADSPVDRTLEARARALSSKIGGDVHEVWMDDLAEITEGVDKLFGDPALEEEETSKPGPSKADDSVSLVSSSLPATSSMRRTGRGRRRPSLDTRRARGDSASSGHLDYNNHGRNNLIASAPRALTLYVDSTDDPASILLPSTLGLRSSSSSYFHDTNPDSADITASSSRAGPSKPPLPPPSQTASSDKLDHRSEVAASSITRAYDLLSSVVNRNGSPQKARRTSISEGLPPSSSSTFSSVSRRSSHSRASAPTPRLASPDPGRRRRSSSRSRSMTPRRHYSPPPLPRPMTPPIEELSSASTNSTDSQPDVSRTLQTLRKILDDQPRPPEPPPSTVAAPRRASFMPKSPPPAPASGTSTATASVSRLFTKGTHHSSTRPPSPPRHSSLKQRSEPPTPVTASPSLLGIPGSPFSDGARSVASSGRSTPKRISFAELPESYGGSKPGGPEAAKYPGKRGRRKKKEGSESEGGAGWWTGWLLGANGTYGGTGMSMSVEGAGEGAGRGWGGKARFGGPMDEWGI